MDRRGRELAFTSNAGKIHAVAQDLRPLENVQMSVFLTNIMHSFVYLRRERGLVRELCQHNIIVFIEGISGGFYLHIMYTHHRQGMWINRGGARAGNFTWSFDQVSVAGETCIWSHQERIHFI